MGEYSEECLRTFLKDQGQLFDEPVAETRADCIVDSVDEILEIMR